MASRSNTEEGGRTSAGSVQHVYSESAWLVLNDGSGPIRVERPQLRIGMLEIFNAKIVSVISLTTGMYESQSMNAAKC